MHRACCTTWLLIYKQFQLGNIALNYTAFIGLKESSKVSDLVTILWFVEPYPLVMVQVLSGLIWSTRTFKPSLPFMESLEIPSHAALFTLQYILFAFALSIIS
jgi:hypothetical protein